MQYQDKILGSLLGAAIGDTMGAVTELRPKALIRERFGGEVRTILTPPDDTFARGSCAGRITDDFSLLYYTTQEIINSGGRIDDEVAVRALLSWAADDEFFRKYAGPTTQAAVRRLRGEQVSDYYDFICCDNAKASNGSAMKIAPAGFFNPGNIDKAVRDAIVLCRPTHNNNLSISGASAIAAAVSEAMRPGANLYSVVQAGMEGAKSGAAYANGSCAILAGPDVEKRMKLAVTLAMTSDSLDEATTKIADLVGTGLHISESVPAVFGILIAARNDPMEAIIAAVNIGSDTDTIASMTGAIMGALHGVDAFSKADLELIESVNHYDLRIMARDVDALIR